MGKIDRRLRGLTAEGGAITFKVVAASGGDYTTVGSAIAAGATTIFVKNGTYTESAITSAIDDLNIIGESKAAIIAMGANNLTLSGARVNIYNVKITLAAGAITMSGVDAGLDTAEVVKGASANGTLTASAARFKMTNCYINDTGTATTSHIQLTGSAPMINGNTFDFTTAGTTVANAYLTTKTNANYLRFSNNYMNLTGGATVVALGLGLGSFEVGTNTFVGDSATGTAILAEASIGGICGNNMTSFNIGVSIPSAIERVSVIGNTIVGMGTNAILLTSALNNMVIGNTLSTTSTTSTVSLVSSYGNIIIGNRVRIGNLNIDANSYDNIVMGNVTNATTNIVDAGTLNTVINNLTGSAVQESRFVNMKNTSGGALTVGTVVVRKAVAAGNEVTTTTSASDPMIYGVVASASIADATFGRIQVLGKTVSLKVDGTTDIAIGDYLTSFTSAGIAAKAGANQIAFAIALEAYTADDSNGVIDALLINPIGLAS